MGSSVDDLNANGDISAANIEARGRMRAPSGVFDDLTVDGADVGGKTNLVFRPGSVAPGVYGDWASLYADLVLVQGFKTIQFDDSIVTPCVIPAGVWDMAQTEWFAFNKTQGSAASLFSAVTISDGASFTNLRKIGGDISVTNLNSVNAPIVIGPYGAGQTRAIFEIGAGLQSDFPLINNNGAAPFFDCTALLAGQEFLIRGGCQISGTSPAVQFGASPGRMNLTLFEARINAGMIAGTNLAATLAVFLGMSPLTRQSAWAGSILRGQGNSNYQSLLPSVGATPFVRTLMFPAPVNQLTAPPSAVALTLVTGLGHNTTLRLTATAGAIVQPLPLIRAAAPAIGSTIATSGVLNSEGMITVVRDFGVGPTQVSLTPAAGETIEGGAGPLLVPVGGSRILQSDGISDWRVIAGYL